MKRKATGIKGGVGMIEKQSSFSLRHYFAGKAIQGLLSGAKEIDLAHASTYAIAAYQIADAMIQADKRKPWSATNQ